MRSKNILIALFVFSATFAALQTNLANAQQPEPAQAIKQWSGAIGHWVNEEQRREGPDQPWESATSEWTVRFLPGGYFVETPGKITFSDGREVSWEQIWGYDPVEKVNFTRFFNSEGNQGYHTFRWTDKQTMVREGSFKRPDGEEVRIRGKSKYSPESKTLELTVEHFSDGKWWIRRKVKGKRVD